MEIASGHTSYGLTDAYGEWIMGKLGCDRDRLKELCQVNRVGSSDFSGCAYDLKLPARFENSMLTAERACSFLREQGHEKPFFLSVGFQDPHGPHAVPEDYTHRAIPEDVPLAKAYYYALVQMMDEQIGRALDCMEELKLTENTIVVFLTDHGELLGDHGMW